MEENIALGVGPHSDLGVATRTDDRRQPEGTDGEEQTNPER